jgi:hypothetical protein
MPSLEDIRKAFAYAPSRVDVAKHVGEYVDELVRDVYDALPDVARDILVLPVAVLAGGFDVISDRKINQAT